MIEVKTKWVYPKADPATNKAIKDLAIEAGITETLATIFYNRNVQTKEEVQEFLTATLRDVPSHRLLKDIEKVAERVIYHLQNGEVTLYSDYDCDGWGCVIVFVKLMKKLGYEVNWFTNTRSVGYGMKPEGVDTLMKKYPNTTLILTSDNGIVAFEGIEHAMNSYGLEVCVTDHHDPSPDGRIPNCSGVVNPKRLDETYPFNGLCGTGVIYKLCKVIYEDLGKNPKDCDEMLDIVAVATVGDVVPLRKENRVYVKEGLKMINDFTKPIWKFTKEALTDERNTSTINSKELAFSYVPAINACSRLLGNMDIPINTFLLDDSNPSNEEEIRKGLYKMDCINKERKQLSENQTDGVVSYITSNPPEIAYTIWNDALTEGIAGIIAGKVCEKFFRPTIILTNSEKHPNIYRGSGRCIDGIHIKKVLDDIQTRTQLLDAYGGHAGACGLTIKKENLNDFYLEFILAMSEFDIENRFKEIIIDLALADASFNARLFDEKKMLEPFGCEFPEPIYGIRNFEPIAETFGGDTKEKHIKFKGTNVEYICWNNGKNWIADGKISTNINCIGELSKIDTYSNKCQITSLDYSNIHYNK